MRRKLAGAATTRTPPRASRVKTTTSNSAPTTVDAPRKIPAMRDARPRPSEAFLEGANLRPNAFSLVPHG